MKVVFVLEFGIIYVCPHWTRRLTTTTAAAVNPSTDIRTLCRSRWLLQSACCWHYFCGACHFTANEPGRCLSMHSWGDNTDQRNTFTMSVISLICPWDNVVRLFNHNADLWHTTNCNKRVSDRKPKDVFANVLRLYLANLWDIACNTNHAIITCNMRCSTFYPETLKLT